MQSKEYIGHGTKHGQWDLIDVVIDWEKAREHSFQYEGRTFVKFTVAARRQPSEYGKTHSVYVRPKEAAEATAAAEPAPKTTKGRKRTKA
jgi:hypothetical protein